MMPKFLVREVKEIVREIEVDAHNADHAIKIFMKPSAENKQHEGNSGSYESHITAKRIEKGAIE